MKVTIHQPEYLPWLGFFNKVMQADIYVALDNVQYRHKYFQNRNMINTPVDKAWLNVPVKRKGKRSALIKDVEINNLTNWRTKNLKAIKLNYKNTPYFEKFSRYFEDLYSREWDLLAELNLEIIQAGLVFFNSKTKIVRASDLPITGTGEKLILDICKHFSPETYISGKSGIAGQGTAYEKKFKKAGIEVVYQEFEHPKYEQKSNKPSKSFLPNASFIDLFFNHGSEEGEKIIKQGWSI